MRTIPMTYIITIKEEQLQLSKKDPDLIYN